MPVYALGRRPPKNAPALRLASFLTGVIPDHPAAVDHFASVDDWGLYNNDRYGVCGPTSVANQVKLITAYLTGTEFSPSQEDVYDLYRRSGNPGFDPTTGAGDGGVDMQTMLEALLADGIGGRKPLGFAKVDHTNPDELWAAIAIFGSLLLGVDLDLTQQDQTHDGMWDYEPSSPWGGHAVLTGRYVDQPGTLADRTAVVTWAELVDLTDRFMDHQLAEAWVVIWPEHLGATQFQQGVDKAKLAAAYEALTGRPFPVPVTPPTPQPVPPPAAGADAVLAVAARAWLSRHHSGLNRRFALDVETWLTAKGL